MRHSKSRLVEDADESAPVRLQTAPTPIISLQVPIYRDARRVGIYPDVSGIYRGDRSRPAPNNKFISIYRGDRSRGAKVFIYFLNSL